MIKRSELGGKLPLLMRLFRSRSTGVIWSSRKSQWMMINSQIWETFLEMFTSNNIFFWGVNNNVHQLSFVIVVVDDEYFSEIVDRRWSWWRRRKRENFTGRSLLWWQKNFRLVNLEIKTRIIIDNLSMIAVFIERRWVKGKVINSARLGLYLRIIFAFTQCSAEISSLKYVDVKSPLATRDMCYVT